MAVKLAEDGMYEGDPYRTLPNNARTQVGYLGVRYQFEETPEGASGVAWPEPKKMARQDLNQSPSKKIAKYKHTEEGGGDVSLSSSPSPSASPGNDESDENI